MDKEELQRTINRITERLQHLRDQIRSSEKPGMYTDLMFELMTGRQMLVEINEKQPDDPACREQIDEVDKLMELFEKSREKSNVQDTSNEQEPTH